MKVLTIFLTLFLWTETQSASVNKPEEPFMELVIDPVDGPLQSGDQPKNDFEVVVQEEGEFSEMLAKYQTDYITNFEEEEDFVMVPQEEGEPLSEIDFYNAQFIDISSPDWMSYKADSDPILKAGLFEGDIDLVNISNIVLFGRNAVRETSTRWPDAIVPYSISTAFDNGARTLIARAMAEYHKRTCIRFVPRTNAHKDYMYILEGRGCSSAVGRAGGAQDLSLGRGCLHFGVIVHELMHAIGFWHEQSRADRDDYVTIVWDNIQTGMEFNFQKYSWNYIQALGEAYDLGSVMHYEPYAFARRRSEPTIIPKVRGKSIGQRQGFSDTDLRKVNALYRCEKEKEVVVGGAGSKCADGHGRCVEWAEEGECDKNAEWMRPNCMKACGLCGVGCSDLNGRCTEWNGKGECDSNPRYMKRFCKKSCGVCTI